MRENEARLLTINDEAASWCSGGGLAQYDSRRIRIA